MDYLGNLLAYFFIKNEVKRTRNTVDIITATIINTALINSSVVRRQVRVSYRMEPDIFCGWKGNMR